MRRRPPRSPLFPYTTLFRSEPLVIWHADEDRPRLSFDSPWEESLEWLRRSRSLFTPRAYAAHLMSVTTSMAAPDRKSTRLNSSHLGISYAVFCLKKKK